MYKMLRKNEDGSIETFYVETFEKKQRLDTIRKHKRQKERLNEAERRHKQGD